jgi:hypothetical protein
MDGGLVEVGALEVVPVDVGVVGLPAVVVAVEVAKNHSKLMDNISLCF